MLLAPSYWRQPKTINDNYIWSYSRRPVYEPRAADRDGSIAFFHFCRFKPSTCSIQGSMREMTVTHANDPETKIICTKNYGRPIGFLTRWGAFCRCERMTTLSKKLDDFRWNVVKIWDNLLLVCRPSLRHRRGHNGKSRCFTPDISMFSKSKIRHRLH